MKLSEYIKGERKGKEAHKLEKEAMGDPFLQEAIDGFDIIDGDHLARIAQLRKRIEPPQRRTLWAPMVAAASVLLIVGGLRYFWWAMQAIEMGRMLGWTCKLL